MTIWVKYFTSYFIDSVAVMYLLEVKEYISKNFVEIRPLFSIKWLFCAKLNHGALLLHAHILIYFYFF